MQKIVLAHFLYDGQCSSSRQARCMWQPVIPIVNTACLAGHMSKIQLIFGGMHSYIRLTSFPSIRHVA